MFRNGRVHSNKPHRVSNLIRSFRSNKPDDACRLTLHALMITIAWAIASTGCSSTSSTSTGPSPVKCQVSLATSAGSIAAGGGNGGVSVSTQPECAWDAAADASWISGLAPTSGQGSGQIQFAVAANPDPVARQADIKVNGETARVRQDAAACRFEIAPRTQSLGAPGGTVNIVVTTTTACSWTASSSVSWIAIASGASATGNGSVRLQVDANTGNARTGAVTIAGETFTVAQASGTNEPSTCAYALTLATQTMPASGGSGTVGVKAGAGCSWTAISNVAWITITNGMNGIGDETVTFAVAANGDAAPRTGTLTIANQTFTITQAAGSGSPCSYAIDPKNQSFTAAGGSGTVSVSAAANCGWIASSVTEWIAIDGGSSGSGSGKVTFSVAANAGGARTASLTVAGQVFTVTQAAAVAACSYSINPTSQAIGVVGGVGTPVVVTTTAGCNWTATSGASWITITSGASGSGGGSVTFAVVANTGGTRTGTLTVAGQAATVTQAGIICSYKIDPTAKDFDEHGGTGTVAVTTTTGCPWTAVSNESWITITAGAIGAGSGSVTYAVQSTGGKTRTGTLTVAGQTFTVTESKR